jgi:hypothetical protein
LLAPWRIDRFDDANSCCVQQMRHPHRKLRANARLPGCSPATCWYQAFCPPPAGTGEFCI